MADGLPPNRLSRRSFVKYAAIGGAAAVAGYSALVYPSGWQAWIAYGRKPWEVAPGVVDYDKVKEFSWGPSELGFQHDIRASPEEARVLNIAQWYDYWPADTVRSFTTWMQQKWNVPGVRIVWTSNIYTSNEELFTWITQTGRKFDLVFPTNYTIETLEKGGHLANMNKEWIPNYVNIFGRVPSPFPEERPGVPFRTNRTGEPGYYYTTPGPDGISGTPDDVRVDTQTTYPMYDPFGTGELYNNWKGVDFRNPDSNGYAYRGNLVTYPTQKPHPSRGVWSDSDGLVAVPYQWGTTGIGYRTDIFDRADIERLGWKTFELATYTRTSDGRTFDLTGKKMMLDDMREVFTAALKATGWKAQEALRTQGLTTADPTAITANRGPTLPPGSTPATYGASPFRGEFQWTGNEVGADKLAVARDWLLGFKSSMWGFSTVQQGPWLVTSTVWLDQAWSGDIMYAVRPNTDQHVPVEYFVPREGGARWIDNAAIHRECEKLWLAHEFVNYLLDPVVGAGISDWNLYATPCAWSFELLAKDPRYSHTGQYPDGRPYYWNPAEDYRIYTDFAVDGTSDIAAVYRAMGRPPILERCEYQKDVGVRNTLNYFREWREVKF